LTGEVGSHRSEARMLTLRVQAKPSV